MDKPRNVALVVGGTGLLGGNLIERLHAEERWDVVTLSRRHAPAGNGLRHVAVDLLDADACQAAASLLADVTHVFYLSRYVESGYVIPVLPNVRMLGNLLDALEPAAPQLAHVQLMHGCKWYGVHVGPYRTPARETDPRPDLPLYYYGQHDLLKQRQHAKSWTWSTLRPHFVCGVAVGSPSNLVGVIGAYAAVLRELGMPLRFPGSKKAFESVLMYSDVDLVSQAMTWAATSPRCGNEDINVANGDFFRWCNIWPMIAELFGMPAGEPQPLDLVEFMRDKTGVWQAMQRRHGLVDVPFDQAVDWSFANSIFRLEWDQALSVVKAHQLGFSLMLDSEQMLLRQLRSYREARFLP